MSALTVTNLRLGFATNSSSSHSVVLGSGSFQSDPFEGRPGDFDFGWDSFELTTAVDKAGYFAAAVFASLYLPDYQKVPVARELFAGFGINVEGIAGTYGIDHQSGFTLPDPQRENFPALVKEALDFFADQRTAIYGGNDNEDDYSGRSGPYSLGDENCPIRLRRDGDNYVLFNWRSGAKTRFAPQGSLYGKSSRPELVDLKITDACPYRCDFCYQGSTPKGRDGDRAQISDIVQALGIKGLGVFEVAIGGGEPTAYEHFASVIDECRDNYIKPNFTTFAVDWLLEPSKVAAANLCGGIGVSVHTAKDIGKIEKIAKAVSGPQVLGQHVYGTLPMKETGELFSAFRNARLPLLLLGYKATGFGASQKPHDLSRALGNRWDMIQAYQMPDRISVDTAFAQSHPEFLEFVKANEKTVSRTEGAFSMYIDAVASRMGPSSYCNPTEMSALPMHEWKRGRDNVAQLAADIGSAFTTYPGESV